MPTVFLTHPPSMLEAWYGPRALHALQSVAQVVLNPHEGDLRSAELARLAAGADAIVSYRQTAADAALFENLPRLRAFLRCAVDIRNIDVAAASRHGVLVTRASPGFVPAVAEWVLGAMIDLGRSTSDYVAAWRQGQPLAPRMGRELCRSTLGIVGYGHTGRYLGELALACGMQVVVHDPFAAVEHVRVRPLGFEALLAEADFVVCLAAATAQNTHLFDAAAFAAMRRGSYFVNASRGSLVDEAALLAALDAGTLAGCALDVGQAPDQMPTPRLAAHPRVLATPHIAGLTQPAIEHQALETVQQLRDLLAGREPVGAVNGEAAWRWREMPDSGEGAR